MDIEKLNELKSIRKSEEELYTTVGSIVLNPEASLNDYILATISVLNRIEDGPIHRLYLEYATKGVAYYSLWDQDTIEKPKFEYGQEPEQVRRQTIVALVDLISENFVIHDHSNSKSKSNSASSGSIIITNRGLHALRSVMPEEDLSRVI
jgi:hypothetical protein